jgi:hypothetical protein
MPLEVKLEGGKLTVAAQSDGFNQPVHVGVGDTVREIKTGESFTFST